MNKIIAIIFLCASASAAMQSQRDELLGKDAVLRIEESLKALAYNSASLGSDDLNYQVAKAADQLVRLMRLLKSSGASSYNIPYTLDSESRIYCVTTRLQSALLENQTLFTPTPGVTGLGFLTALGRFERVCDLLSKMQLCCREFKRDYNSDLLMEMLPGFDKKIQENISKIEQLEVIRYLSDKINRNDLGDHLVVAELYRRSENLSISFLENHPTLCGLIKGIRAAHENSSNAGETGASCLSQESASLVSEALGSLSWYSGSVATDEFNVKVATVVSELVSMRHVLMGARRYCRTPRCFDGCWDEKLCKNLQQAVVDNQTLFESFIPIKRFEVLTAVSKFFHVCKAFYAMNDLHSRLKSSQILQEMLPDFEGEMRDYIAKIGKLEAISFLKAKLEEDPQGGLSRDVVQALYQGSYSILLSEVSDLQDLHDLIKSIRAKHAHNAVATQECFGAPLVGVGGAKELSDALFTLRCWTSSVGTDEVNRQIAKVMRQLMCMQSCVSGHGSHLTLSQTPDTILQKALKENQMLFDPQIAKGFEELIAIDKFTLICAKIRDVQYFLREYNTSPLLQEMLPGFEEKAQLYIKELGQLEAIVYLRDRENPTTAEGGLSDRVRNLLIDKSEQVCQATVANCPVLSALMSSLHAKSCQRVQAYVTVDSLCPGIGYLWRSKYPDVKAAENAYIAYQMYAGVKTCGFVERSGLKISWTKAVNLIKTVGSLNRDQGQSCAQVLYYLALEMREEIAEMRRQDFLQCLPSIIEAISDSIALGANQKKNIIFVLLAPHLSCRGAMSQDVMAAVQGTAVDIFAHDSSVGLVGSNFFVNNAVYVLKELHFWEMQGRCSAQMQNCARYIKKTVDQAGYLSGQEFNWNQVVFDVLRSLSGKKLKQSLQERSDSFLIKMKPVIQESCRKDLGFWKAKLEGSELKEEQKTAVKRYIL